MVSEKKDKIAIWVITPNGIKSAEKLRRNIPEVDVYVSQKIADAPDGCLSFRNLSEALAHLFSRYSGHIFVMSAGIVVRVIAPLIKSKVEDPAVVVMDDRAKHAISLLSGHLGGANALTLKIANIVGADPVITTATDVNQVPAIDVLAGEMNLLIENPRAIKSVNMALLKRERIFVHDPFLWLGGSLPNMVTCACSTTMGNCRIDELIETPCIYVDDVTVDLPPDVLVLRPASLVVGIGCNRNTGMQEMKALVEDVLEKNNLALSSLRSLATIDMKSDEKGLLGLAENLKLPIYFYSRQELNEVKEIKNPSKIVEKHVGVKSVCEAAAILAAGGGGALIVSKQTTPNVTVAVARITCSSLEPVRAASSI